MKEIKVGIIGSGGIANIAHVPGYLALRDKDVRITALCDIKPEAMENTIKRHGLDGVEQYLDFRQMLRKADVDVVSVCTPNNVHMPATVAALQAGKHVICEKPIARNGREGTKMVQAARKSRRQLMIGQSFRFGARPQAVKRAIDAGMLGDIYYARSWAIRRREVPAKDTFLDKEKSGGGPLIDIGVHSLDLTLYLMGFPKPVRVSGRIWTKFGNRPNVIGTWGQWDYRHFEVEDCAVALIHFANGAAVTLEASFASNISEPLMEVVLLGTAGGAEVGSGKIYTEEAGTLWDRTPYGLPKEHAYLDEIAMFVDAVRNDKPVPVPGHEALMTVRILDAIYQSAKTGKEVKMK